MQIGRRSLRLGRPYHSSASKRGRRIAVIVALPVFVFQFSLSLLLHPLNQILCIEGLKESSTAAVHDHHHADAVLDSHTEPAGDTMQHCKDTLFGIAVTPLQPFSLPLSTSIAPPQVHWTGGVSETCAFLQRFVPPPFQPPRA